MSAAEFQEQRSVRLLESLVNAPPAKLATNPGRAAFCYRLAYAVGNAVVLAIVFAGAPDVALPTSGPAPPRTAGATAVIWAAFAASWVAYLVLQGSDPGYVPRATSGAGAPAGVPAGASVDDVHGAAVSDVLVVRVSDADGAPGDGAGARARRGGGSTPTPASASPLQAPPQAEPPRSGAAAPVLAAAFTALGDADPDYDARDVAAAAAAAAAAHAAMRTCRHCAAAQPARAHHCRTCDRCVATFDHHCGMVGTCIGERNRFRFWTFLLAQTVANGAAIGALADALAWRREWGAWAGANALIIATLVALSALQALTMGLLGFHCWLAATNTTTFETVTGSARLWYLAGTSPRDCDLPYSRGLRGNLRLFCCALDDGCATGACTRRRPGWAPHVWPPAGAIDRDSVEVWSNLWENRYWSCC